MYHLRRVEIDVQRRPLVRDGREASGCRHLQFVKGSAGYGRSLDWHEASLLWQGRAIRLDFRINNGIVRTSRDSVVRKMPRTPRSFCRLAPWELIVLIRDNDITSSSSSYHYCGASPPCRALRL